MSREIHILKLGKTSSGRDHLSRILKKNKLSCLIECAAGEKDFLRQINKFSPDVLLIQGARPTPAIQTLLRLMNSQKKEIPMIQICRNIRDGILFDFPGKGKSHYVLKTSLERVPDAIRLALEKKNLDSELKARAIEQVVVAQLGQRALKEKNLDQIIQSSISAVTATLGVEFCGVFKIIPGSRQFLLSAGLGWKEGRVGTQTMDINLNTQPGFTLLFNHPVIVEDFRREERFKDNQFFLEHSVTSGMSVVIRPHDELFGVLSVHSRSERLFTEDEIYFLESVANVLAEAIDRKNAEIALLAKTRQLETVSRAMLSFLENGNWLATSQLLLQGALDQTESQAGFLGVVLEGLLLRILAHQGIPWDEWNPSAKHLESGQRRQDHLEIRDGFIELSDLNNLFGTAVTSARGVLANDLDKEAPRRKEFWCLPSIRHFLAVPILRGSQVVGIIAVANRAGGYSGTEQGKLEILTQAAGIFYDSYRRNQHEELLEAQLLQSQKMEAVGRLAGGIAHDFNNLLTAIMGYSDFIWKNLGEGHPMRDEVKEIQEATERAASLTHQLLAFGRKQLLEPKVIDLNTVVSEMEKMLRRVIGENIEFQMLYDAQPCPVKVDPVQIEQVIVNLAINARDAMPKGGRLTLKTEIVKVDEAYSKYHHDMGSGEYILLIIEDTGVGMSKEVQSHLFEPFFTTKERGKGSGLGLSTVYGIIKQSGGFIYAYSEPNIGTSFKVYLPRVFEEVETMPRLIQPPLVNPHGTETILLVEDEAFVRKLAREILQTNGYTVLAAQDAEEAFKISGDHKTPIDLVISDVVMPKMNGKEFVEGLLKLRQDFKVLYISGYIDSTIAREGLTNHRASFLQKPFTAEVLSQKVREILDTPPPSQIHQKRAA